LSIGSLSVVVFLGGDKIFLSQAALVHTLSTTNFSFPLASLFIFRITLFCFFIPPSGFASIPSFPSIFSRPYEQRLVGRKLVSFPHAGMQKILTILPNSVPVTVKFPLEDLLFLSLLFLLKVSCLTDLVSSPTPWPVFPPPIISSLYIYHYCTQNRGTHIVSLSTLFSL